MMENPMTMMIRTLVEAIHSSPTQAVLFVSGGASQALGWLASVPGASNTLLEVIVPYSRMSMIQLLGKVPLQFTSKETADDMALLAYNRALKLSKPGSPVVGVGFTGSLATTHPKLGDHRFHLSTRTSNQLWASSITLTKGLRSREQEEQVSSQVVLKAIADACKVSSSMAFVSDLAEGEVSDVSEELFDENQELEQLIHGKICFKVFPFSSGTQFSTGERKVILSGSFNPLHDGHLKLLEVATSLCTDGYPCFELSAINADKPPLSVTQIKDRVKQFEKVGKTVIISNQPYFYKKAELFPGSAFVIGADTAARLINPKYYGGSYENMIETLQGCKRTGCTFLVGGRNMDGAFKVLDDFDIPDELKDMFISIPVDKFRMDISSTELRNSRGVSLLQTMYNCLQKGDKTQEYLPRISEEIPESLAGPSEKAVEHTSLLESTSSSHHIITNYDDAVKVLSEVELPNSPTRVATATAGSLTEESNVVIRLHDQGQSSGTKKKAVGEIEGNVGREREQKHDLRDPGHQRVTTDTDKRRRNLISERVRALQALVPNCNKRDTVSILSDAIDYIKYLQMQVQTMSTHGLYMFPTMQPRWQAPNLGPPPFAVRPSIGMQQGIPQHGFYAPENIPVYSPPFSGFPPLMPPMEVGSGSSAWRQPSPYLYPQQPHFPSQQQLSAETSSQGGSPVPGQPSSYHAPVTTQGT